MRSPQPMAPVTCPGPHADSQSNPASLKACLSMCAAGSDPRMELMQSMAQMSLHAFSCADTKSL